MVQLNKIHFPSYNKEKKKKTALRKRPLHLLLNDTPFRRVPTELMG